MEFIIDTYMIELPKYKIIILRVPGYNTGSYLGFKGPKINKQNNPKSAIGLQRSKNQFKNTQNGILFTYLGHYSHIIDTENTTKKKNNTIDPSM